MPGMTSITCSKYKRSARSCDPKHEPLALLLDIGVARVFNCESIVERRSPDPAHLAQAAGVFVCLHTHAGVGHRRKYCDFQCGERHTLAATSVQACEPHSLD